MKMPEQFELDIELRRQLLLTVKVMGGFYSLALFTLTGWLAVQVIELVRAVI